MKQKLQLKKFLKRFLLMVKIKKAIEKIISSYYIQLKVMEGLQRKKSFQSIKIREINWLPCLKMVKVYIAKCVLCRLVTKWLGDMVIKVWFLWFYQEKIYHLWKMERQLMLFLNPLGVPSSYEYQANS